MIMICRETERVTSHADLVFDPLFSDQYLMEFLEDGGVHSLLDILGHSRSNEEEKTEALRLLLTVSNAGRKYKEIICESHGKLMFYLLLQFLIQIAKDLRPYDTAAAGVVVFLNVHT